MWCDSISKELPVNSGVPQGSILGPLLFAIAVADLPGVVQHGSSVLQYVDDTQLYIQSVPSEIDVAIQCLNNDLSEISLWSSRNGLVLNPSKSVVMCCGSRVNCEKALNARCSDVLLSREIITFRDCTRNLGIWLDSNLNFDKHVNSTISKCYAKLKCLYYFKDLLQPHIKWKLCNAIILSIVHYSSSVYYFYLTVNSRKRLQKLQNSCYRFAFGIRWGERITPLFVEKNILKIEYIVHINFICFLYRLITHKVPDCLYSLISRRLDVHNVMVRNRCSYCIPAHYTSKFEGSFMFQAPLLLNKHFALLALSFPSFKKALINFYLDVQSHC